MEVLRKKVFMHKLISMTIYASGSTPFLTITLQKVETLQTETIALSKEETKELLAFLKAELES